MKKIKILFYMNALSGGGAERTVVNIMNNLDSDKFDILLVLRLDKNNEYIELVSKKIKIIYLKSIRRRYSLLKLRKTILEENPDMMFSTINDNNIILLTAKILSLKKIPTIVREANNRTQSGKVTFLNRLITYAFYNYISSDIIALSEGVKVDLVENFHINRKKINVIYNPVETLQIHELCGENIDDYNKVEGEKLIISVGRLVEQKDFVTLIRAFGIVSSQINAKLLILGKGPEITVLENLSKDLGVDNNVVFLGFKRNPYKYMKASDIFVLSSKWEGFGHVIVEAMASGTPVISTDCNSGPSEIIGANKYGILVPVEDYKALSTAILGLLNDDEQRIKYSRLGYYRSTDFDAKSIVKQYENIFLKNSMRGVK